MKQKIQKYIKPQYNKLKKTGFFSILLSTIFSKIIVFLGGIVVVRLLSKNDYGLYAYVINCLAVMRLLNDFGASSAILQFSAENYQDDVKQTQYIKYGVRVGLYASLVSSLIILLSPLFYPYSLVDSDKLTTMLFLIPFLATFSEIFSSILRANLQNKKYGILQIFMTLAHYIPLIILSLIFGLTGAILSQYFYYTIVIFFSIYLCWPYLKKIKNKSKLNRPEKKQFLKYSLVTQINSTIGGLLLIIDTFLIGLLIANEEILATYNVAAKIPHVLAFLPSCVIIYALPYFVRNNKNIDWIKLNYRRLLIIGSIIYGIITLGLVMLSKPIFIFLFGHQYLDAIPTFIVLMIGFFFSSTFKTPSINILNSMKKLKFNFYINVISIVINFISNIIFIRIFGYIGAAITTTMINIISSLAYFIYIKILFRKRFVNDKI